MILVNPVDISVPLELDSRTGHMFPPGGNARKERSMPFDEHDHSE